MKTIKRKVFSVTTLFCMLALILSACSGAGSAPSASTASSVSPTASTASSASPSVSTGPAIDNSKEVKIVGYLLGEAPKGMPDVLAALNVKLKKDINATLELNYIGWGDLDAKYPLILASGDDVDFVYAADWNKYIAEANKGSFKALTPDLLQTYMPKYYAKQDPAAYKAAQVNGKQFMIPTTTPDRKSGVIVLRKDVMDKAGLTNPTKISELEPYFAEVKKDYPDMIPLNLDSAFDLAGPFDALAQEKFAFSSAPIDSGDGQSVGVYTDNEDVSGKILSITDEPVQSAFKGAAATMKKWYDAGYINKNPFSNKVRSKDNFCEGKSGVALGNSIDIQATLDACKAKGIDTYILPTLSPSGHTSANSWLNNGIAIAANSKNTERTLQMLDLLMQDESYVYLDYFGIEGKNYTLTNDGKITLPAGVTATDNTYPPDAAGFWFVNKDLFKPMASWTDSYINLQSKMKGYLHPDTYMGFAFNSESVKAERAALKTVATQYYLPLVIGEVKDVDKAFNTLVDKMNSAGVDKVKAEVEKQASAFLAAKK